MRSIHIQQVRHTENQKHVCMTLEPTYQEQHNEKNRSINVNADELKTYTIPFCNTHMEETILTKLNVTLL